MNNKGIIFALGTIFGATGGSLITYFIVNKKRDEELEEYAEHCDERIAKIRREIKEIETKDDVEDLKDYSNPEDDEINKNEGVKKYHHNLDGLHSKYGENNIFGKAKVNQKLIKEINEEEFMNNDNGYKKEVIDILLGDDSDIVGFWGYETDNEVFVDKKFNTDLKDLIGEEYYDYNYLLNLSDEEDGIGTLYIRNDSLMTEFEIIIHDFREEDK